MTDIVEQMVAEARLDAKAFRENTVYDSEGDPVRLVANADRLDQYADTITTLRAEVAKLREGLSALLAKSDAVRVLAAEQAQNMPSKTLWTDDVNQFLAAQEAARALLETAKESGL